MITRLHILALVAVAFVAAARPSFAHHSWPVNTSREVTVKGTVTGWDRSTLRMGDVIAAIGYRFNDGSNILRLQKIVMANGKEMFLYGR